MISAPSMCQVYPVYTSGALEDIYTALHGSGEGYVDVYQSACITCLSPVQCTVLKALLRSYVVQYSCIPCLLSQPHSARTAKRAANVL